MPPDNGAILPPEVPEIDHAGRWAQIVERRRVQMETAYAAAGIINADYWGKRAKSYRQALHEHANEDPFLQRVRAAVSADSTVLDVGAGPGRHTLPLAQHVARVVAVEPSPAMSGLLVGDVEARRLRNVDIRQSEWLSAEVEAADVVICSHVLYPIRDVMPFVRKLETSARKTVFVYLRTDPLPTDLGLWPEFYGVPLQRQPVHMDLINVLAQGGIFADVEIVEHRFTWTFADLDEAQQQMRNSLCLAEDDIAANAKLRRLLEDRLETWPDGRLGPHVESARSAIISWSGTAD